MSKLIVYTNEPCPVEGKLITYSQPDFRLSLSQRNVLILPGEMPTYSFPEYLQLVRRVANLNALIYSVDRITVALPIPPYLNRNDMRKHWESYAEEVKRVAPQAELAFIFYRFLQFAVPDLDPKPEVIALPARRIDGISCHEKAEWCADNIAAFLAMDTSYRIHLLAPTQRVLRALSETSFIRYVDSIDITIKRGECAKLSKRLERLWQV